MCLVLNVETHRQKDSLWNVYLMSSVVREHTGATCNCSNCSSMFICYYILCHSDLTGDFEVIKLCDFGVVVPLKTDGEIDTEAGAEYVGTLPWCAPEVLCNNGLTPITNKADIFSFGLVLWEMITLSPPHLDDSLTEDSNIDIVTDDTMASSMVNAYGKLWALTS